MEGSSHACSRAPRSCIRRRHRGGAWSCVRTGSPPGKHVARPVRRKEGRRSSERNLDPVLKRIVPLLAVAACLIRRRIRRAGRVVGISAESRDAVRAETLELCAALASREARRPSPRLVVLAAAVMLAATALLVHDVGPPRDKPQAKGGLLVLTDRSQMQDADAASIEVRTSPMGFDGLSEMRVIMRFDRPSPASGGPSLRVGSTRSQGMPLSTPTAGIGPRAFQRPRSDARLMSD